MLEQSVTAIAQRGRRRWDRGVTVNFMAQAEVGRRVGQSQVKLAAQLGVPRNTLRYWRSLSMKMSHYLGGFVFEVALLVSRFIRV